MIAVDTSALMAILLHEPEAESCVRAIESAERLVISAGTLSETLIVASRRSLGDAARNLIAALDFDILPVTAVTARRVAAAHDRWGRGVHPAALNFGDCFAYDAAASNACPLLYIGHDFARTDIRSAI